MMFCKKCGTQFEGAFCPKCGTPSTNNIPPSQAPEGTPYTPIQNTASAAEDSEPKKRKVNGCFLAVLIMIIVIIFLFWYVGHNSNKSSQNVPASTTNSVVHDQSAADTSFPDEELDPPLPKKSEDEWREYASLMFGIGKEKSEASEIMLSIAIEELQENYDTFMAAKTLKDIPAEFELGLMYFYQHYNEGTVGCEFAEAGISVVRSIYLDTGDIEEKKAVFAKKYENVISIYNDIQPSSDSIPEESPKASTYIEAYSDNLITIAYYSCETSPSSNSEAKVVLVVENKMDSEIIVRCSSLSINGWNLSDAYAYQRVAPQSKGYVKITTKELPTDTPEVIKGILEIIDTHNSSAVKDYDFRNIPIEVVI